MRDALQHTLFAVFDLACPMGANQIFLRDATPHHALVYYTAVQYSYIRPIHLLSLVEVCWHSRRSQGTPRRVRGAMLMAIDSTVKT